MYKKEKEIELMKKKLNFTKTKLTAEETENQETVIQYLDEHYTKGEIFEMMCFQEMVIGEEIPWRTTKRELLEMCWYELMDYLVSCGEVEIAD